MLDTKGCDLLARKNTSAEIKWAVRQRDWASQGLIDWSRPLGKPIYEIMRLAIILEFFRQDERFYAELANLAGLPAAWRLVHSVKSHADRARIMLTGNLPQRINVAFNEHIALINAKKGGDIELSKALVSKHINSALEAIDAAP